MGERKGLFSRFFGRKKKEKPAEDAVPAAETEVVPIDPAPPPPPPVTVETPPLDAAQRTIEAGTEPVAVLGQRETSISDQEPEGPRSGGPSADPETQTAKQHDPATEEMLADAPKEQAPQEEFSTERQAHDRAPGGQPAPPAAPPTIRHEQPTSNSEAVGHESAPPAPKKGFFGRLAAGLSKTSQRLSSGIGAIFTKRKLDDATLEELEDLLITADLGVPATTRIIEALSKGRYNQEISDDEVRAVLAEEICQTLEPLEVPLTIHPGRKPHIVLMTGVNGAGKTTTIGKLAKKFTDEGLSVLLAAGDTFRAAAIEQLKVWGERTGAPVVARETGADAAGLAFDAIKEAQDKNIDVVMIDTAGRLQNRRELMDELAKIVRVIQKLVPDAPHDTLLVLDATVGQNALSQAKTFTEIAGVSGLVMTKLDGTARGGVLVALGDAFGIPIHYIGVGESAEDLQPFSAERFAAALTAQDDDA